MDESLRAVLTEAERLMVDETDRDALNLLDEDGAIELEARIRRARNEYVGQYRRSASAAVAEQGGRGKARPRNARALAKAEAFERSLSSVSHRVAVLASKSAAELRAQRLAAAKAAKQDDWPGAGGRVPRQRRQGPEVTPEPTGERALRNPASEKQRAGVMAGGARQQARRDSKRASARLRPARAMRFTPRQAVAVTIVILVAVNVVDVRVPHAALVVGPSVAALLLWLARAAGLSWAELGLGPGTWRPGLRWAAAVTGVVAVVLAAGAALPATRDAFRDSRYHLGWADALLTAFVLIPVGTVLLEEVAFRGVLWGLLRRLRGTVTATAVSSALFGVWHVLPSLGLAASNAAVGGAVGRGRSAQEIAVLGTVLFTAASGVVFCELRRRSGSLLAPAALHWAVNGLSVLASAAVWAWATR